MKIIKNTIGTIKHFVNCIYYYRCSVIKNIYPCKLIGEKINPLSNDTTILFKVQGQNDIKQVPLQYLLNNRKTIEKFHPTEAVKLGSMALKEVTLGLTENEAKTKFNRIKNIMLSFSHDSSSINDLENSTFQQSNTHTDTLDNITKLLDSMMIRNFYPYRLVGGKTNTLKMDTTIVFTILGKREGYERSLQQLLVNTELIEKFHPTEAVKLGFISEGDSTFC